jgi:threonine/homoserine/homoserine lactone efflux protein
MVSHFFLFIVMVTSLIIVPGPDMLYVVGRSIVRGRLAGWYSALGVAAGYAIFTVLVAAGVGFIFETRPELFFAIKIAGLIYLTYLAYRLFISDGEIQVESAVSRRSLKADFAFGVLTSTLNPKGILFYFSILPQFFILGSSPLWRQAVIYGLTTSVLCLLIYYTAGLGAIYGLQRWQMTPHRRKRLSQASGAILLFAIAILIATTRLPTN